VGRNAHSAEIGTTLATDILYSKMTNFLEEEGFVLNCVLDPYSALDLTYESNYNLYLFDVN